MTEYEICVNLDQCLQRLAIEKKLAVATPRIRQRAIQKSHLYCFDESQSTNTYFVAMYVNRRFYYWKQVHVLTERFFEAGLFQKWTKDSKLKEVALGNQQIHKLSFQTLLGAFFVYSLTFFGAIVALAGEIIVHKEARRQNAGTYWIISDRVFDNNRYVWTLNNESTQLHSTIFTFQAVIFYVFSIMLVYVSWVHNF